MKNKVTMLEYMEPNTKFQVGSHYFAKEFLKAGYEVEWVEKPKVFSLKNEKKVETEFNVISPKVIMPFCKYPVLNSEYWAKNHLRILSNTKKLISPKTDILWMTNVKMYELSNMIQYEKMIHRVADNFSGFKGSYDSLIRLQNQVIEKSDLTIVTAKKLLDNAYKINKNSIYLPNGVDFSRFENIESAPPIEFNNLDGPKITYVGAIEEWFDFELIINSAKKLLNCYFIFIGNKNLYFEKEVEKNNLKNIIFLGLIDHKEIPKYLKYSDVGIMPFVKNNLTEYIHPLKIYEYLAAGLPVVCRNLTEVREMNAPINLYDNEIEFIDIIKHLVSSSITKSHKKELVSYAKSNSWEDRFSTINNLIKDIQ